MQNSIANTDKLTYTDTATTVSRYHCTQVHSVDTNTRVLVLVLLILVASTVTVSCKLSVSVRVVIHITYQPLT